MPSGVLQKMKTQWVDDHTPVAYSLRLGKEEFPLNLHIGKKIQLKHTGQILCIHCGKKTKKSFSQGYCYPCFISLAETDMCIVKPHQCHHHLGTCRDNEFAQNHCFIPHLVYLAVSSAAKVGITREHQKFTRWADQGATSAIEFAIVADRKTAGEIEIALAQHIPDKTNWRKMLSTEVPAINLADVKKDLEAKLPEDFKKFVVSGTVHNLIYPALQFPAKINSFNLDKNPEINDTLIGIKGQYLIFENGVINLRKYQGYEMDINIT